MRDEATHRGLARAHEADEREVDGVPVRLHDDEVAENRGGRTTN
jgi:hypothetical protein